MSAGSTWSDEKQACVSDDNEDEEVDPVVTTCPEGSTWSEAQQKCVSDDDPRVEVQPEVVPTPDPTPPEADPTRSWIRSWHNLGLHLYFWIVITYTLPLSFIPSGALRTRSYYGIYLLIFVIIAYACLLLIAPSRSFGAVLPNIIHAIWYAYETCGIARISNRVEPLLTLIVYVYSAFRRSRGLLPDQ